MLFIVLLVSFTKMSTQRHIYFSGRPTFSHLFHFKVALNRATQTQLSLCLIFVSVRTWHAYAEVFSINAKRQICNECITQSTSLCSLCVFFLIVLSSVFVPLCLLLAGWLNELPLFRRIPVWIMNRRIHSGALIHEE